MEKLLPLFKQIVLYYPRMNFARKHLYKLSHSILLKRGTMKHSQQADVDGITYFAKISEPLLWRQLKSSRKGLTKEQAEEQLRKGRNVLVEKEQKNIVVEFLSHFGNPLVLILLAAAGISDYLGATADAVIIAAIILVSVSLDFFQEHKANNAAQKLKERVVTTALVLRNSKKEQIKVADLCPGDVIFLNPGNLVPADARIIEAKDFFINQSSLTGESFPCEKNPAPIAKKDAALSDLTNIVFLGTSVISGSATAVIVKTGPATEFGKIAKTLVSPDESEFDRGIKHFGYLIMRFIIVLVLFIFFFRAVARHEFLESFIFAVAVAVGLTPELLPIILSVSMAKGSVNMAKKGVIVKKLSSIPNLGSMDILCTDKTGTLTQDAISLVKYVDVAGKDNQQVLLYAYLNSSNQTGIQNPMDKAVLDFKKKSVLKQAAQFKKVDEIPFDFVRKRISVVVRQGRKQVLITKGAPEEIFKICSHYKVRDKRIKFSTAARKKTIMLQYTKLSEQGYRVLALASRHIQNPRKTFSKNDEINLTLLGFIAFLDPAKEDVREVIQQLKSRGIEVKIITGDNELVTKKICNDIGLEIKGIMLGSELHALTDEALRAKVELITIFARFSPNEKNRVIEALKANKHVVGYLGDGINDAPSLKTADVGISVNTAVDVAKESASIILTHKSLRELQDGVLEGRKTFANTMKYIMMGISSNFGNMFSFAGAVIFLPFLPMLPVQILFNNLIYDFSQITIPSDNVDEEYIEKPKKWNLQSIKRFMWTFGPLSSFFDFLTFFVLYWIFKSPATVLQTGWFLESLATQTLVIHIIRTKKTPFFESIASNYLLLSSIACVAFGWLMPFTPIGKFFGFTPLPLYIIVVLLCITLAYLIAVEIVKRLFYFKYDL